MFRKFILGTLTALFASHATADMTLKVGIEEYNDFFKRCDLSFTPSTGSFDDMSVVYRVLVGEKGAAICHKEAYSSACRDSDDLEFTCEEMTRIAVFEVSCKSGDTKAGCGDVAVAADGLSIPVEAAFPSGSREGVTRIFATVLGYDDFFDDCEMGYVHSARDAITNVSIDYDIMVGGEAVACNTTLSGHGGTSRSCSSAKDYTCDQVTSVEITNVTCKEDDADADCGAVEIHAVEEGFFKDVR